MLKRVGPRKEQVRIVFGIHQARPNYQQRFELLRHWAMRFVAEDLPRTV